MFELVLLWLASAVFGAIVGFQRGALGLGLLLGLFLGPFGVITAAQIDGEKRGNCRRCREWISLKAAVCPFCHITND